MQVPTAAAVSVVPETVQGPELTRNEFEPPPLPPNVVKLKIDPYVPLVEFIVSAFV